MRTERDTQMVPSVHKRMNLPPEIHFCEICGNIKDISIDNTYICKRKHTKKPTKKQPQFRGTSKWARETGMFEGLIE